jgi:hypothetical protein
MARQSSAAFKPTTNRTLDYYDLKEINLQIESSHGATSGAAPLLFALTESSATKTGT